MFQPLQWLSFYRLSYPTGAQGLPLSWAVRTIDPANPQDVARHDKVVALVQRMLDLDKKLEVATIPAEKKLCQGQIEATDEEIDALEYELYGLTEGARLGAQEAYPQRRPRSQHGATSGHHQAHACCTLEAGDPGVLARRRRKERSRGASLLPEENRDEGESRTGSNSRPTVA
jgi:hypothetical protein